MYNVQQNVPNINTTHNLFNYDANNLFVYYLRTYLFNNIL